MAVVLCINIAAGLETSRFCGPMTISMLGIQVYSEKRRFKSCLVHEYGGGSFIPNGENGVLVANNGGIYALSGPLAEPRPIVEFKDEDVRHADFWIHGDYVYAIRERHSKDHHAEPENLLIRVKISEKQEEILVKSKPKRNLKPQFRPPDLISMLSLELAQMEDLLLGWSGINQTWYNFSNFHLNKSI